MTEPQVTNCTVRSAVNEFEDPEFHIECRLEDGQKYPVVVVDGDFPMLANKIADFLNRENGDNQ